MATLISAQQLILLELAFLVTFAFLFLAIPTTTIKIMGLPAAGSAFWPRLLGAAFLGLALALLAGAQGWTKSGLGLGGLVALNLTIAFVLMTMLVVGQDMPTRRGKVILWFLALLMAALGFVEIAYVT